jgi:cell division protein FtsI/penicillin-binding protein 2
MQIAAMTAAFANYGHRVTPRLVQALIGDDGQEISTLVAPSSKKLADDDAIKAVREGMRRAVTSGSAQSLSLLSVEAAAKTGTAQWGRNKSPHAWFTSFAPYDNPELVVTVMIEEGEGGSISAAPVARRFYDWWFSGRPDLAEYRQKPWYWTAPAVNSDETDSAQDGETSSTDDSAEPATGAVAP